MNSSSEELKCSLKEFLVKLFLINFCYHKEIINWNNNLKNVPDTQVKNQCVIVLEHLRNWNKFVFFLEGLIRAAVNFVTGGSCLPDLYEMEATYN